MLGVAIGFSSVDRDDSAQNFGIGAGIWGALSALVAFFIGGLTAAGTAAGRFGTRSNTTPAGNKAYRENDHPVKGWLQGLMVWAVTIPLSAYLVAGAAAGIARSAGSAAATGVQATATATQNMVSRPDAADRVANADTGRGAVNQTREEVGAATQQANDAAKAAGEQLQDVRKQVENAVTPENVETAAGYGATAAWGVLISMVLGLAASVIGGLAGSKLRD